MTENAAQRKLCAIFSADVKGYSKLMDDDDEATVATITAYRDIISQFVLKHQGRVIDTPGDNILAVFTSALNAVQGAVDIQQKLAIENAKLTDSRRMQFRIGINLGDILQKGNWIYGDSVNIAARIESLADPGGICISAGVYDQVKNKIRQGVEYSGDHKVKNISEMVRIYRILLNPKCEGMIIGALAGKSNITKVKAAVLGLVLFSVVALVYLFYPSLKSVSLEMSVSYPDKPSIAVLPFDNMSGDSKDEYLCDGVSEGIIANLAKVGGLFVIARNSTFTYKGKLVKVQQISQELGVRYVLEGSLIKSGNRVRVNARLIEATTGQHIWSENYDRMIDDIFLFQDDIIKKIIEALQVKLTWGEQAVIYGNSMSNLQAYSKYQMAQRILSDVTNKETNAEARKLFQEIIQLEPNSYAGYSGVGWTHLADAWMGFSDDPESSLTLAEEFGLKALHVDVTGQCDPFVLLGAVFAVTGRYDESLAMGGKAVEIGPSSSDCIGIYAFILQVSGFYERALEYSKKAIRLSPFPSSYLLQDLAFEYFMLGMHEESISECRRIIRLDPDNLYAHQILAANYTLKNRVEKAYAESREIMRIDPTYSQEKFENAFVPCYKDQEGVKNFAQALRKAFLK